MRTIHIEPIRQQLVVPLVRSREVGARSVVPIRYAGTDVVVWRDDAGIVNVWEDRCPHRGVRLSIGTNTGTQLKCRYHGWRFESGSGRCAFIPSHPEMGPPVAARVRTMTCAERYDFVWLLTAETRTVPDIPELGDGPVTSLRSMTIDAPAADVRAALDDRGRERSGAAPVFLLLPETPASTTVHGIVPGRYEGEARANLLRGENKRLKELRAAMEAR
jgi:nitrite reductase/ring-hydroxylating ferredoxin subunit